MKPVISPQKTLFAAFLQAHFTDNGDALLEKFSAYLDVLYEQNGLVNLISRQMPKEDYWLYHFLDSLLIINTMGLNGEEVLDFGSGGGLPGIPLKLVFPDLRLTMLDSVGKKVKCLEQFINALELKNCRAVWSRLEDYAKTIPAKRFDLVLCRSVKMEPAFFEPVYRLLKPNGKAVFYKAQHMDDVTVLPGAEVFDVSLKEIGTRQLVVAGRGSFGMYLNNKRFG
jgi:16S rRNA (guanine527-N7)-methyltransferase